MLKRWNHSITAKNNAVTYYQTLEEVLWHPRADKNQKCQKFSKKNEKNCKTIESYVFIERLFVSS